MKPSKLSLVEMFEKQRRYVVPLFQRPYVWEQDEQWEPLWQDITGRAEAVLDRDARGGKLAIEDGSRPRGQRLAGVGEEEAERLDDEAVLAGAGEIAKRLLCAPANAMRRSKAPEACAQRERCGRGHLRGNPWRTLATMASSVSRTPSPVDAHAATS